MNSNAGMDNPLLGTWHLVRWDITYSDGRPASLPFGGDAAGLILYTGDGMMSACIARGTRGSLSSDSMRSAPQAGATPPHWKATFSMQGHIPSAEYQGAGRWCTASPMRSIPILSAPSRNPGHRIRRRRRFDPFRPRTAFRKTRSPVTTA